MYLDFVNMNFDRRFTTTKRELQTLSILVILSWSPPACVCLGHTQQCKYLMQPKTLFRIRTGDGQTWTMANETGQ